MQYPERPECDFAPEMKYQGDLFRFGFTQCDHCSALVHQAVAVRAVYYNHTEEQVTEDYCSERCKQTAYIKRLNTAGM